MKLIIWYDEDMIYVFWASRDKEEAKRVVHGLLDKNLIACASIFPEILSIYRWEGKVEEASEVKVILKTQRHLFGAVASYIQEHCSYDVPEIVEVEITQASANYLSWLENETC